MKKTGIAAAIAMVLSTGSASALDSWNGTFQMYAPDGIPLYFVGADVSGQRLTTIDTTPLFLGETFVFKNLKTYTSTFSVDNGSYTNISVGPNQIGASMLFDWGPTSASTSCGKSVCNLDVIQVWDVVAHADEIHYLSTDIDGTGWAGAKMLPGTAYAGYSPAFDMVAPVPVPTAVWLFGSGLLGMVGLFRRKKHGWLSK